MNLGRYNKLARQRSRSLLQRRPLSTTPKRDFIYFENLEVKNNIGIVRLNSPNKMNTISNEMQMEVCASINIIFFILYNFVVILFLIQ